MPPEEPQSQVKVMQPDEVKANLAKRIEEEAAKAKSEDEAKVSPEDSEEESMSSSGEEEEMDTATEGASSQTKNFGIDFTERSIQLQLPGVQLQGISLLEPVSLNLTLSCNNCSEVFDATNVVPGTLIRRPCIKCRNDLAVAYEPQQLHGKSAVIALVHVRNCRPFDLLPSAFVGTCSECLPEGDDEHVLSLNCQKFSSVMRGYPSKRTCGYCQRLMTLQIGLVNWQRTNLAPRAAKRTAAAAGPSKKQKADELKALGIEPGKPLPANGTCKHYGKSYRWFRFPCCGRVYPCDVCHEEKKGDKHELVV